MNGLAAVLAARKAAMLCAAGGVLLLVAALAGLIPTWLPGAVVLGLGVVLEIAFRVTSRRAAARAAQQQGAAIEAECRRTITKLLRGRVIAPVNAELATLARFRTALDAARGSAARR